MQPLTASFLMHQRVLLAAAFLATFTPSAIAGRDSGPGPTGRSGNYLIILAEEYEDSAPLNDLVNIRTALGFTVMTHTAAPGTTNTAIKSYIQSLWDTPDAPDYILLIGDTDGTSAGSETIPHWVGGGTKHATTDLPYACMDAGDDWYPDIAIGRFSVRSVSQLQDVADKTLVVESGNYPDPYYVTRAAFLASNDLDSGAEETHDWVIENYMEPADYECIKIYGAQGGNTQDVTNAVNAGCIFVVYGGHSSSSGWSNPAFHQGDVRALSNAGLYGLVFGWSCNSAHFDYAECFGETWLREANKGAAAFLSASTYIYYGGSSWESSRRLEKYFFESFFVDDIWEVGPAWQAGLYRFLADPDYGPTNPVTRNMFEMFVLLGDPALELPRLSGFTLDADPESLAICAPDDAVYTIDVQQIEGYSEPVTLSASGAPLGTIVTFSVNPVIPPGTSVMTVGNTGAALPGEYLIEVIGTSIDTQRSTFVELNLSDSSPPRVTLSSPPDGAVDIVLKPTLTWLPASQASEYELVVATDLGFTEIVYSATVTETSHTLADKLDSVTAYYWHVRGTNACGIGEWSDPFSFTTLDLVSPTAYDMLNGETGTYTYFDDTYDGDGNNQEPLAPLSGGLGDLTDGVITTENWDITPIPYVGWKTVDPTITCHFANRVMVRSITLYLDDANGGGSVYPPTDVTITMGDTTLEFDIDDPVSGEPFAVTFDELGLAGETLELTLADHNSGRYFMLSEIEIYGNSCPGDLDGDGDIDLGDLAQLLSHYGQTFGATYEDGDMDGDGDVDLADLSALLAMYGTIC